jgi:hypothetical protein
VTAAAEQIRHLYPCAPAVEWLGERDLETAWSECERGDWMLWLATRAGVDRRLLVQAACDCAETALQYVPEGEERPRVAVETARAWCRGEATLEEVREAAYADDDAAYADAADAAAYAADAAAAAAYAADAADAAAYAAYAARLDSLRRSADLVRARISAADVADAAYAARLDSLRRSADLVRARISAADVAAALAGGVS